MCKNYNSGCRNRTATPHDKKCWRKWRLCGDCAVKEHPKEYSERYVRRVLSKLRIKNGKSM